MDLNCAMHNWYDLLSECTPFVRQVEYHNVSSADRGPAVVEEQNISSVEAWLHAL